MGKDKPQDQGASLRDRAVVNGAGQAVSALRASVPSARVTVVSRREEQAGIADRFERQYAHYTTAPWNHDKPIALIVSELRALNLTTCDYAEIDRIIGSKWSALACDICDSDDCEVVARIGDAPDYEARWQDVCLRCLAALGAWAVHSIPSQEKHTGWDHRYRRLDESEIIRADDEVQNDDGSWRKGCLAAGQPAPDPSYTSHRVYRRLKAKGGEA